VDKKKEDEEVEEEEEEFRDFPPMMIFVNVALHPRFLDNRPFLFHRPCLASSERACFLFHPDRIGMFNPDFHCTFMIPV